MLGLLYFIAYIVAPTVLGIWLVWHGLWYIAVALVIITVAQIILLSVKNVVMLAEAITFALKDAMTNLTVDDDMNVYIKGVKVGRLVKDEYTGRMVFESTENYADSDEIVKSDMASLYA